MPEGIDDASAIKSVRSLSDEQVIASLPRKLELLGFENPSQLAGKKITDVGGGSAILARGLKLLNIGAEVTTVDVAADEYPVPHDIKMVAAPASNMPLEENSQDHVVSIYSTPASYYLYYLIPSVRKTIVQKSGEDYSLTWFARNPKRRLEEVEADMYSDLREMIRIARPGGDVRNSPSLTIIENPHRGHHMVKSIMRYEDALKRVLSRLHGEFSFTETWEPTALSDETLQEDMHRIGIGSVRLILTKTAPSSIGKAKVSSPEPA